MSDKKSDWETPRHDPDKKSGEQKRADIWSNGPTKVPNAEHDRFNFIEFDEVRGRRTANSKHEKASKTAKPNGKKRLFIFLGLLIALYLILKSLNPSVSVFDTPYGVKALLFMLIFGGSFVYFSRASKKAVFKAIFGWIAIVSVIAGFYVVGKGDTYRTMADNITPAREVTANGEMQVQRARDGHFWIMTQINGQNLPMMVDTGASMVVLSKKDARRIGIDVNKLRFNGSSSTANGTVSYARTRLDDFVIGHVAFNNFTVTVNGGQMEGSLLGLDALNQFKSYEMRGDMMILRP